MHQRQTLFSKNQYYRSTIVAIAAIAWSGINATEIWAIDPSLPNIDCTQATSNNVEMQYCAEQSYQAAQRQFNQTYQQVLSRLSTEEQQKLREIQQSWTGYRDRHCELEAYPSRNGTGYGLFLHQCLERLTKQRTIDLEHYLDLRQEPNTPNPSHQKAKLADLPDGNYRYWTGTPQGLTVTDEQLINDGGVLFHFRKQGDQIVGIYGRIDNETICINGRVTGNTIAGNAVQTEEPSIPAIVLSRDDRFAAWDPSAYLQVRRGRRSGNFVRYDSALLDLNPFNRINAGSKLPPNQCP